VDLRPYQSEAVEAVRQRFRERARKVLLICPTGGGKTVVFSHIALKAVEKGSRVVVIAHRRELVKQASDKLNAFGLEHGIIQAGYRPRPHLAVQVASIQTLQARPASITRADLVVIDEAHHTTTRNGYAKVLARFPEARVLGVTATPWRLDGKGLGDVFEAHVVARTPRELRDDGFLVPVGGWEYEAIDTSSARVQRGDFVVGDLARAATSSRVVGDIVGEWLAHAAGKRTVLFALSIEHSQYMAEAFKRAGVRAEHVDGEMDTVARDADRGPAPSPARQRWSATATSSPRGSTARSWSAASSPGRRSPPRSTSRWWGACCARRPGRASRGSTTTPAASPRTGTRSPRATTARRRAAARPGAGEGQRPPDEVQAVPGGGGPLALRGVRLHAEAGGAEARGGPRRGEAGDHQRRQRGRGRSTTTRPARRSGGACSRPIEARQYGFFMKMVAKHGLQKGCRVYWWFSGKTARAPAEWIEEARARAEGTAA
jgi:hypothetical protein